ncbi:ankyrin [Cadophora sp. DSE1049]|nr:ankyrin [Cadophora sp. DSE1049]
MELASANIAHSTFPSYGTTTTATPSSTFSTRFKKRQSTFDNRAVIPGKKRSRLMGRPKNDWTPSRKRKLVRLYLMTQLDVDDIGRVLSRKGFIPCKRDVQKQLNALIRHRPNQIRFKGPITKRLLQLLRECKELRRLNREEKDRVSYRDLKGCTNSIDIPSMAFPSRHHLLAPVEETRSGFISEANFEGIALSSSKILDSELEVALNDTQASSAEASARILELAVSESTYDVVFSPDAQLLTSVTYSPVEQPSISLDTKHGTKCQTTPSNGDGSSIVSAGKASTSALSIRSLKRRLPSKYSTSIFGDVQSLIGRLSISSRSETSGTRSKMVPDLVENSMLTSTSIIFVADNDESFDVRRLVCINTEPVLPGALSRYCWEHISQNRLVRCGDIRLPCNRGPMFRSDETGTYQQVPPGILSRIRSQSVSTEDLGAVDSFGNSVLHIAAALGSPLTYMISLIRLGADVKSLNNANQTFLHVVHIAKSGDLGYFYSLLSNLAVSSFDFLQQDLNGQTAIHTLAQDELPWKIFSSIVQGFRTHKINFKTCRDRMGNTIAQHLQTSRFTIPDDDDDDGIQLDEYDFRYARNPRYHAREAREPHHDLHPATYVDSQSFNEYIDVLTYGKHAQMLRTVIMAGEDPQFEDVEGCNGLHCLAKVSLTLSKEGEASPNDSAQKLCSRRQRYLDQLLESGVNPNSYDCEGSTPLMSFIVRLRDEESDDQTTQLLGILLKGGASINSRNRQGESALHIAVRLGRRSVTEYLLSQGANVHARTNEGLGVLAHGLRYSERASDDAILYAQISLCMCLVGRAGAVAAPTLLDEWASPELRILGASTTTSARSHHEKEDIDQGARSD